MLNTTRTWLGLFCAALALACFFASPAAAGEDWNKERAGRELRQAKQQIVKLRQEARDLRESGDVREAEEREIHASEIERRLKEHFAHQAKAAAKKRSRQRKDLPRGERLERIVHGLVAGIEALHQMGGQEQAIAHLKHLIGELKRKHAEDERRRHEREKAREEEERRHHERERAREEEERRHHDRKRAQEAEGEEKHAERRALEKRLDTLRLAHVAFREGEKREAAEQIETIIHAGELLLEGRWDEEARKVYELVPGLERRVRLLQEAARLWRGFEEPRKAKAVEALARYYAEGIEVHHERERKQASRKRVPAPQRRRAEPGRDELLAHLQAEMVELQRALQRMQKQLRALMAERK